MDLGWIPLELLRAWPYDCLLFLPVGDVSIEFDYSMYTIRLKKPVRLGFGF